MEVSSLILMHTDTRVLHPLTRKLRVRCPAARHLTFKPSLREHRAVDPHVGRDPIAECVRKDLRMCFGVGPSSMLRCHAQNRYSRAHEWPDRDGRPALWSMSTSGSRGVPTLASRQAFFSAELVSCHPLHPYDRGGSRTDPQYPHGFSCGFAVGAKARGPLKRSAPCAGRDRMESATSATQQAQARPGRACSDPMAWIAVILS